MDRDLAELVDRTRIVETINRLFIATDNRDWPLVKRCFAPVVLFDMSSLGAGPAARKPATEIVRAWDEGLKPLRAIHHQVGNHIVEMHGEKATAFCYGIAVHYLPNPTNANTRTFVGSYDFDLVRAERDRWVIAAFTFHLKYIEGNATLETS